MSFSLGTALGIIQLDYRGRGAAEQATEDLDKVQQSGTKTGPALDKVAKGALVAGAGIVAGLGIAVGAAANFEKSLSGIQAVSGATESDMEALRAKALQLGADTAFSASEASGAMEELVKAGVPVPDVLNGAADAAVALAAAGGIDLPQAAAIAANAMNQFGLSAQDLPGIADKIAGAANASAIDVSDFGMSMSQAGAVAKLAGLGFDDMALAITAMGNAGIKGSDAGTSLKTFLQNLQPSTKKQTELFKELGIVTKDGANQFFDSTGKIKSMSEIAGVLSKSLAGMSDQQKTMALETMFGSDAIRAAAVIAGEGSAGMDSLAASIGKVKAADVAATRMDNMAGKIEQLKGSAETFAIGIGSILLPALTSIVEKGTAVINWFSNLDSGAQKAIVITLSLAAGFLLFVGTLIKMVQFAQAAKAAMIALNGTFLTNPIFLIIMAIIALIAIFVALYKNNEAFRNFVNGMWASIKSAISAVVNWITGTAVPFIVNAWNKIVSAAQWMWGMMTTIWNAIVLVITTYINMVRSVITAVMNAIITVWKVTWSIFGPIIKGVWAIIKAIIQVAVAWILVFIRAYLNMIRAVWTTVWNAIKAVVTTVWNAIKQVISVTLGIINGIVSRVLNAITGVVRTASNAAKAAFSGPWNALKGIVSTAVNGVMTVVDSIKGRVMGALSGIGGWLRDAGSKLIGGLIQGIRDMIGKVGEAMQGIASKIKGFMPGSPVKEGPLRAWNDGSPGEKLIEMVAEGIRTNLSPIEEAFAGVSVGVPTVLASPEVAVAASAARTASAAQASAQPTVDLATLLASGDLGNKEINVEYKVYNPVAEKSSETAVRETTRMSELGVFG